MRALLRNTVLATALVSLSDCAEQDGGPSVGITQA